MLWCRINNSKSTRKSDLTAANKMAESEEESLSDFLRNLRSRAGAPESPASVYGSDPFAALHPAAAGARSPGTASGRASASASPAAAASEASLGARQAAALNAGPLQHPAAAPRQQQPQSTGERVVPAPAPPPRPRATLHPAFAPPGSPKAAAHQHWHGGPTAWASPIAAAQPGSPPVSRSPSASSPASGSPVMRPALRSSLKGSRSNLAGAVAAAAAAAGESPADSGQQAAASSARRSIKFADEEQEASTSATGSIPQRSALQLGPAAVSPAAGAAGGGDWDLGAGAGEGLASPAASSSGSAPASPPLGSLSGTPPGASLPADLLTAGLDMAAFAPPSSGGRSSEPGAAGKAASAAGDVPDLAELSALLVSCGFAPLPLASSRVALKPGDGSGAEGDGAGGGAAAPLRQALAAVLLQYRARAALASQLLEERREAARADTRGAGAADRALAERDAALRESARAKVCSARLAWRPRCARKLGRQRGPWGHGPQLMALHLAAVRFLLPRRSSWSTPSGRARAWKRGTARQRPSSAPRCAHVLLRAPLPGRRTAPSRCVSSAGARAAR